MVKHTIFGLTRSEYILALHSGDGLAFSPPFFLILLLLKVL